MPADFVIAETNDSDAHPFEDCRPSLVVAGEPIVLPTVEFDHELGGVTVEIDDVAIERDLALELGAVEAGAAQSGPKNIFGASRLLAEGPGEVDAVGRHRIVSRRVSPHPCPSPFGRGVFYSFATTARRVTLPSWNALRKAS